MNVSLNITTLTQPVRIALRSSRKQTQRSQPQGEVGQVSRSHSMFFSKRLHCVCQWLFCLSLAILGFSHLSAAAACLSPDPYVVNSNSSVNLVQRSGCTLGSFTVGAGITLSSPSGSPIIDNDGTITTITNNGIISGAELISNAIAGSIITTIVNTGTMSSTIAAIRNQGVISLIDNSGAISSNDQTVRNTGAILDLINTGTIVGTSAGIQNSGVITTLHNQQGSSGGSPLTYLGILPTKYRILIAGTTTFGRLSAGAVTGVTQFGVSRFSTTSPSIINTTYANVLVGITPANLGLGSATTVSDVSNGYSYTLTQTDLVSQSWSLTITACRDCTSGGSDSSSGGTSISNISSGTSVGLASISTSPVLSGGTLVLLSGDSSSTAFSVTSASTIQSPTFRNATLSGVFSGVGGLTFIGTCSTTMSGANTYSGGTTVAGGTLVVAGPSPTGTGEVFVASAGTLMGTGTIAGNGLVSGVLKPGHSPGYLSFTQSLTLNSGSTYQQDIAGTTQASSASPVGASGNYSFVTVGNQLTINSGATLTPRLSNLFNASEVGYGSSIYVPVLGDKFRIITATGGITGRFTTLTQPAELSSGTQFIAFYNVNSSNSVDLVTVPTSYSTTLNSSTTNAQAVAGVLDQLLGVNKVGTSSSAQDSLLYAVAGQRAANLPSFAQALSGEIHAASAATLPQTTQRVQQSVLARLGDYPMAPSQINPALNNSLLTGGISATNPSGLPTASMSTNPAVNQNTVNVTSAAVKDGRAWGEIAYQRTDRASNSAGNGYNSNLYQIVTGVDAYSNAELGLKLGGGIALSNTTVSANGGNSTIQQGSLFVYGKMSVL